MPEKLDPMPKRDPAVAMLELVDTRIQSLDERTSGQLEQITANVEALTATLSSFTTGLTELKGICRQMLYAIDSDRQNIAALAKLAQSQQGTIDKLLEKLDR